MSEEEYNEFKEIYLRKCGERKEQIISEYRVLYDKHYTVEDIVVQIAFYTSPTGQKIIANQPEVSKENIIIASIYSQNIVGEIIAELNAAAENKYIEKILKKGR